MAEYNWGNEKALIRLGQPYLFTKAQYDYCKNRQAPIAVIYYDSITSAESKKLYQSIFGLSGKVKELGQKLSSYGQDPASDSYKGGYCCLFVLDRCGRISS